MEAEFSKVANEDKPVPTRYRRSEQERIAQQAEAADEDADGKLNLL